MVCTSSSQRRISPLLKDGHELETILDVVDAHHGNEPPFADCTGIRLDASDTFPAAACQALDRYRVSRFYVPRHRGGDLHDFAACLQLLRVLARRNLTVAIAHAKTFLGCVAIWIAGDDEQAQLLSERVLAGTPVSWALTERDHGSDLLATELTAKPVVGGYRVSGEKWLINNATRAGLICALTRTSDRPGPRSLSLLLLDRSLIADRYQPLAKELTHGIRGADISGFRIDDALVPHDALVGHEGHGLDTVLKGLQLTRTLCTGLSLGAADRALAVVYTFAAQRQLYGRTLATLPLARHTLGCAATDLLICEAIAMIAARAAHTALHELPVWSAAVKFLVPTMTERSLRRLRRLLGARSLLLDDPQFGVFAKIEQDNALVSIFDGNTLVNLNALINQFPSVTRAWSDNKRVDIPDYFAVDTAGEPPQVRYSDIPLTNRGGVAALNALTHTARELEAVHGDALRPLIADFVTEAERVRDAVQAYQPTGLLPAHDTYVRAEKLALTLAGAACLNVALANAETDLLASDGVWLCAALARLTQLLRDDQDPVALPADVFVDLIAQGETLSLFGASTARRART